jgi:lipopolysaccharide export system protein LptA
MPKTKGFLFVALALFSLVNNLCWALPEDRQKNLELSADSADLNQQIHRGEYSGNVQLDQGSTHLRAAHALTEGDKQNKLVMAEANGNGKEPAHFWTLTAVDKPPLHAYADTIRYFPDRHLVELIGNARVIQGDNSFNAPKISYDTLKQHVVSTSDGKNRTTIIIHPVKKP